jgi:hypothetical protein
MSGVGGENTVQRRSPAAACETITTKAETAMRARRVIKIPRDSSGGVKAVESAKHTVPLSKVSLEYAQMAGAKRVPRSATNWSGRR